MERTFTIQEAAQITGVSTYTLRYYERMNLLDSINRNDSGYRRFTKYDLDCVKFLTKLRSTKMPIRQMQQFSELRRQGITSAYQRRLLLEEHYESVTASQQELNYSLEVISKKIAYYKELEEKEITNEADSYHLSTYLAMGQEGTKHRSINLPLEPETAAQKLIGHFDSDSISKLIELLQKSKC
ncbi:MAG: MerR family transcriptional regulator [Pseudanabaena frigida]|uniref:MerR family transcriptional regulator n=1 Tax=Pseudanabaena frigida TaxID=945775 RepID=A0A2W4W3X7_9CYAN|nr:MAG: MerR family transcriptional regulator [Pseudanabaena frigida]